MGDYQLRKDIDRFKAFLDDLEDTLLKNKCGSLADIFDKYYDQSEVDVATGKLKDDLSTFEEDLNNFSDDLTGFDGRLDDFSDDLGGFSDDISGFSNDLSALQTNLVAFNQSLINFNGDTEALASDLSELSDNFDTFLDDVIGLSSSLELFDAQLNGGTVNNTTYTGFMSYLNNLEYYMYGKGETYVDANNQTQNCTYANPSSTSLKGLLNNLGANLSQLTAGDTQLALTLQTLSSHLTAFNGTLAEFQGEIENAVGSTTYNSLNQYLVSLVYEIASTNQQINDHQGLIEDVQDVIGEDTDTASTQGNSPTLFGLINDTSNVADGASESAEDLTKTLYMGTGNDYNANADPEHPANGSVMDHLNTVKDTTVPNIQKTLYLGTGNNYNANADPEHPAEESVIKKLKTVKETTIPTIQNQIHGGDVANPTNDSLMGRIGTVEGEIGDVGEEGTLKDDINNLWGDIGDENAEGTLKNDIKNLRDDIGDENGGLVKDINDLNGDIGDVQGVLYDGGVTISNPAEGTVMRNLDYLDIAQTNLLQPSHTLDWVFVYDTAPNTTVLNEVRSKFEYAPIRYWYDDNNDNWYSITQNSWQRTTTPTITDGITVYYKGHTKIILPHELGTYINIVPKVSYEINSKQYYTVSNNQYVELTDPIYFFLYTVLYDAIDYKFAQISHNHNNVYAGKEETTLALQGKADKSNTYTKSETYTQTEIDTALSNKVDKNWTTLYHWDYGTIKTDGHIISCLIKSPIIEISNSSWTTMATFSNLGVSTDYAPLVDIYQPYLNSITMRLTTTGLLQANRPSGALTTDVKFYALYAR